MPYCPHCGNEVEHVPGVAAVAETVSSEVEIARINAERDVKVAQINARQERDWNETRLEETKLETEAEVASAEATAEVIGEVLAAETGSAEEEETETEPVVVAEVPEPEPDLAPPPVDGGHETGPKKKPGWAFS